VQPLFCLTGVQTVRLTINGEDREVKTGGNVETLLAELDISGAHIAVAVNLQVVPRSHYRETDLHEGDKVEIVHAVGGGC